MKSKEIDANVHITGVLTADGGMAVTELTGALADAGKIPVIQSDGSVLPEPVSSLVAIARGTVTIITASLGAGAEESGTANIGKTWILLQVVADRACRIRLYNTAAARSADASRPAGTEAVHGVGLIAELIFTGAGTILMSPTAIGANLETVPVVAISYLIQNSSGATHTVTVTLTRIPLE